MHSHSSTSALVSARLPIVCVRFELLLLWFTCPVSAWRLKAARIIGPVFVSPACLEGCVLIQLMLPGDDRSLKGAGRELDHGFI
jgi:hypothetical protein